MNPTALNDLALLAIGIGFGLALALVAVMVYFLYRASREIAHNGEQIAHVLAAQTETMNRTRSEVTAMLQKIDAERLYAASLAIQRASKSLSAQVSTLQSVIFAQPASPALDFSPGGLDEEAADDAAAQAWLGRQQPPPSPLSSLSEEEQAARVQQFFERRRQPGGAYGSPDPYIVPPAAGAAPPAFGSGAYSTLAEQAAAAITPPRPPVAEDFDTAAGEAGLDLTEKGELEQ